MPAPDAWTERPLYVLDVGDRGFAPVTWRDDLGLAGLAYLDLERAQRALDRVRAAAPRAAAPRVAARSAPEGGRGAPPRRPAPRLRTLAPDDPRAREEWLRAVLDAGAARVAFDLDPPQPPRTELTAALLADVVARKRGLACL